MAMPQKDDSPTPRLRRTGTIEAIKRRAAEKKDAEEKKNAEVRVRAAYRWKQRKFEENGLLEGFVQINWSFMAARDELKRRGFRGIHILVNRHNVKAIRCYAVFGFRTAGECRMYGQDFLCYEKAF